MSFKIEEATRICGSSLVLCSILFSSSMWMRWLYVGPHVRFGYLWKVTRRIENHLEYYWGACSPFVSIGLAKSIVLTNALVPDLDALAAFGHARCIWTRVAVRYLLQLVIDSAPSISLAFAVPMYALYLENQSN